MPHAAKQSTSCVARLLCLRQANILTGAASRISCTYHFSTSRMRQSLCGLSTEPAQFHTFFFLCLWSSWCRLLRLELFCLWFQEQGQKNHLFKGEARCQCQIFLAAPLTLRLYLRYPWGLAGQRNCRWNRTSPLSLITVAWTPMDPTDNRWPYLYETRPSCEEKQINPPPILPDDTSSPLHNLLLSVPTAARETWERSV